MHDTWRALFPRVSLGDGAEQVFNNATGDEADAEEHIEIEGK